MNFFINHISNRIFILILSLGIIFFALNAVAGTMMEKKAIAVLHPTEGNQVEGTVLFTQTVNGIKITTDINGLPPGKHGFHIHQWGDCSAADGTSAGGHYNPFDKNHGAPDDRMRHVGDLGNIVVESDGKSQSESVDKVISLKGFNKIIGHAVIVHAGEDDLTSQPTGNAGARLACGVIGYSE